MMMTMMTQTDHQVKEEKNKSCNVPDVPPFFLASRALLLSLPSLLIIIMRGWM